MKVLLLAGGDSSENQVSLNSGDAIFNALKRLGHEVTAIDPADGRKLIAADGSFQKTLYLFEGEKQIIVDSKNRNGKATKKVIHVSVR